MSLTHSPRRKGSRRRTVAASVLLLGMYLAATPQPAAAQSSSTACTLTNGVYTCDNVAFQQELHRAHTIRIETDHIDRNGRAQLEELAAKLGKTIADTPSADLTFALLPPDRNTVIVTPGDAELGSLRIYTGDRQLVWAETLKGRTDTPWPAVVHGIIRQFEAHFLHH